MKTSAPGLTEEQSIRLAKHIEAAETFSGHDLPTHQIFHKNRIPNNSLIIEDEGRPVALHSVFTTMTAMQGMVKMGAIESIPSKIVGRLPNGEAAAAKAIGSAACKYEGRGLIFNDISDEDRKLISTVFKDENLTEVSRSGNFSSVAVLTHIGKKSSIERAVDNASITASVVIGAPAAGIAAAVTVAAAAAPGAFKLGLKGLKAFSAAAAAKAVVYTGGATIASAAGSAFFAKLPGWADQVKDALNGDERKMAWDAITRLEPGKSYEPIIDKSVKVMSAEDIARSPHLEAESRANSFVPGMLMDTLRSVPPSEQAKNNPLAKFKL